MSFAPGAGPIHVDRTSPRTIRVVVHPDLAPEDVRPLVDRLTRRLRRGAVAAVLVDVSEVRTPDIAYVDALARLRLRAHRHGCRVRLIDPCPRLLELLALVGLEDLLLADAAVSGDLHRQLEHREQPFDIAVGVDPGDPGT
jgi:anti-anti-sigma regulatory factor